jgi:lysine 2,3-aminomutase
MNTNSDFLDLLLEQNSDLQRVTNEYPLKTTPYYASLIDKKNISNDPVFKQQFPDIKEISNTLKFQLDDPLSEEKQMPVKHLIHRYRDRAVLLTTNECAVFCRFCMRKRKWKNNRAITKISEDELKTVKKYLQKHPEIREVLISGGDPLMLKNAELEFILDTISSVETIEILRLGTRIPVVLPSRIDLSLAELLGGFRGLWVATHFNHPRELTPQALNACRTLIKKGIPIVNQTVLLKNINDNSKILEKLFSTLAANCIKPLYLFHIDPVKGNEHFATGVQKGVELMESLRNRLSSLATPTFAIDLPEGEGKIPILPDYKLAENCFTGLSGKPIQYKFNT